MTDAGEMAQLLEKEKSRFAGNELRGKTLGVVGLGPLARWWPTWRWAWA
jgi:D-3-phosphoglycerate dehydrogenase